MSQVETNIGRFTKEALSQKKQIFESIDSLYDQKAINRAKRETLSVSAKKAYKAALNAISLLKNEDLSQDAERAIIDKFVALFKVSDEDINSLDKKNVKRRVDLLNMEIDALKAVGIVVSNQTYQGDGTSDHEIKLWLTEIVEVQLNLFKISALKRAIESKYGLNISFENDGNLYAHDYKASFLDPDYTAMRKDVLKDLQKLLSKYPTFMIHNSGLKNVYLVRDIQSKDKNGAGGLQSDNNVWIDLDSGIEWSFDHELLHRLDLSDADGRSDCEKWARINPNGKNAYTYSSGSDAISKNKGLHTRNNNKGFANKYGRDGGPLEDEATVAEDMLKTEKIKQILDRCTNDMVLRTKVEVMTGCKYDPKTKLFNKTYTKEEYVHKFAKYGFTKREYYSKWSIPPGGDKPVMDHNYWNNIAAGNKIRSKNDNHQVADSSPEYTLDFKKLSPQLQSAITKRLRHPSFNPTDIDCRLLELDQKFILSEDDIRWLKQVPELYLKISWDNTSQLTAFRDNLTYLDVKSFINLSKYPRLQTVDINGSSTLLSEGKDKDIYFQSTLMTKNDFLNKPLVKALSDYLTMQIKGFIAGTSSIKNGDYKFDANTKFTADPDKGIIVTLSTKDGKGKGDFVFLPINQQGCRENLAMYEFLLNNGKAFS